MLNEENITREWKEDTSRPAKEKVSLFFRWDRIVNMSSSDISTFRNSEFGQTVGLSKQESPAAGLDVLSGQETSKKLESIINKAAKLRKQPLEKVPTLPDWTKEEWEIVGRQIRMISRFRANIGDLKDDEGNPTPKAGALMLWGRDEEKANGSFPNPDEIKEKVKDLYKKEKEKDKQEQERKEK